MTKFKILKVRDEADKAHKSLPLLYDLPMRISISGKSQYSGKSTIIFNLLVNPAFNYQKYFLPENIFFITNNKVDNKMRILTSEEVLDIPDSNIMPYNEEDLEILYDYLEQSHIQEPGVQKLLIFDDIAASGDLKAKVAGVMSKFMMNGRHILCSLIITTQKQSLLGTNIRSNLTGAIIFNTSLKELELIELDHNFLKSKKAFISMFRDNVKDKRDFIVVNYSNKKDEMYLDKHFNPIDISKYED